MPYLSLQIYFSIFLYNFHLYIHKTNITFICNFLSVVIYPASNNTHSYFTLITNIYNNIDIPSDTIIN